MTLIPARGDSQTHSPLPALELVGRLGRLGRGGGAKWPHHWHGRSRPRSRSLKPNACASHTRPHPAFPAGLAAPWFVWAWGAPFPSALVRIFAFFCRIFLRSEYGPKYAYFRAGGFVFNSTGRGGGRALHQCQSIVNPRALGFLSELQKAVFQKSKMAGRQSPVLAGAPLSGAGGR